MRSSRRMIHWALRLLQAAAGVLAGIIFFHLVVMPLLVRRGRESLVPDLTGLTVTEARTRIAAAEMRLGEQRRTFDDSVPPGRILQQNPPAGFRVKQGREIDQTISLGPEELRVPDLRGESLEHARFLLMQSGLEVGKIRTVHTDEAASNCIVASSPSPRSQLRGRAAVDLLVSLGPPPQRYLMPDVRGRSAHRAAQLLSEAGFDVRRRMWPGSGGGHEIVEQTPPPGYPIEAGATVELITGRARSRGHLEEVR